MKHVIKCIAVGLLLWPICGWSAQRSQNTVWLTGQHFRAGISKATGRVTALAFQGGSNFLHGPVIVSIRDEVSRKVEVLRGPVENLRTTSSTCFFKEDLPDLSVQFTFSAEHDLALEIGLRNKTERRRDLSVLLDLGGLPAGYKAFLPSTDAHPYLPTMRTLVYGYRAGGMPLVIPSATFYSRSAGAGLTLLSPLKIPIQGFQVTIPTSSDVEVGRTDLRLEPGSNVNTGLFLDLHQPDWRPGLKYIRTKFPDHFYTHNSEAVSINGTVLWSPTAPEEQVRQWHEQGVRWVEVHFTYPFLGKYVPDQPEWTPAMDDLWAWEKLSAGPGVPSPQAPFRIIRDYLEERLTPWENREKVGNFIRLLHRYDIKALMYWQPSECWSRYAAKRFMADAVRDTHGNLEPTWYEDIVLDPRPGSKWAEYLEQQFKGLLAYYREANGIFEDQSMYDLLDYAHDDGFSIHNGKTAYRMGYAICLLASRLAKYAHSRGKVVWWNGPYQIELGSIGDGHIAEGSSDDIQWLGIGNIPTGSGAWYPGLYDRMLLIGSQIASPSLVPVVYPNRYAHEIPANAKIPPAELRDFDRYEPLFQQIREREWVLTANAVEVPKGLEANVFRRPDGNYVIPVVTSWGGQSTGISLDVPVTVRVPDPATIRGVYLLTASHQGWFRLHWNRKKDALLIRIPRHHRASLLILAKTGFFAAIGGEGVEIQGHTVAAHITLDNWFKGTVSGYAHLGADTAPFKLKPESSESIPIAPQNIRPFGNDRLTVPIHITFSHGGQAGDISFEQQFVQVPALEAGWEGTPEGYSGETTRANFYLINHGKSPVEVSLHAAGSGLEVTGFPSSIRISRNSHRILPISIRPDAAGQGEIRLRFSTVAGQHELRVKVPVWRTRFDPHAGVIAGKVTFQEFVKDGMPDLRNGGQDIYAPSRSPGFGSHLTQPPAINPRPVDVDGHRVAYLPSLNQDSWRGESVAIPLNVLRQMGKQAQVTFYPANKKDKYRLRNVQIVLQLTDGSALATHVKPQEFSTLTAGQGTAQPIRLHFEFPVD